jgi:HD-GYP domain-containing protein (c-di-GMP phosphodiesterase class II)
MTHTDTGSPTCTDVDPPGNSNPNAVTGLRTRGGYVPVPIAALQVASDRDFDLYSREVYDNHVRYVLFRSRRISMTERALARLVENNVRFLYIKTAEHQQYTRYLETNLPAAMSSRNLADHEKTEILFTTALRLLEEIFCTPNELDDLRRVVPIVDHIAQQVLRQPRAFASLAAMNRHDHYTTTHLVNVSGYMAALAVAGGIGDPAELREVALGGLLHDLGKICISGGILNKPDKLSDREWSVIQDHPVKSLQLAAGYLDLSEAACRTLVEHHERMDGRGYPRGLAGNEIHPHARVAAICDVFDSLTSHRMYRPVLTAEQALQEMEPMTAGHLDPAWFRTWRDLVLGQLDARHWPPPVESDVLAEPCAPEPDTDVPARPAPLAADSQAAAESDRRQFTRCLFDMEVGVECIAPNGIPIGHRRAARAVDLSRTGIGLLTDHAVAEGTRLRIIPPDAVLLGRDLTGRVVHSRPVPHPAGATRSGVRFQLGAASAP